MLSKNRVLKKGGYALIALALLLTTVLPVFTPVVSAKTITEMTPTESAKSKLYYNMMVACIKGPKLNQSTVSGILSQGNVSLEGVNSYKWFGSGNAINVGYFLSSVGVISVGSDNGKVNCGKEEGAAWVEDALTLWGYTSGLQAWCDITDGMSRDGGGVCDAGGTKGFDGSDAQGLFEKNFESKIRSRVYGGNGPTWNQAAQYVYNSRVFMTACLGNNNPSPYSGNGGSSEYLYSMKFVQDDGTIPNQAQEYAGIRPKSENVPYAVNTSGDNVEKTCNDLANDTNSLATEYALWYRTASAEEISTDSESQEGSETSQSSCAITGVGWIVCPVIEFLANITDGIYTQIQGQLAIQSSILNTSGSSQGTYTAWQSMRDIANVLFIIAFLVVIFSQLTSFGITNYGVKKLLPKIIVVAILVNLSFFLCQLAVDLSNILGSSLRGFISGATVDINTTTNTSLWNSSSTSSSIVTGILATAAAGTALAYAGIGVLVPIILGAVVAVLMVFLILVARQALVILLVVVAPIAVVAMLLPNTQKWFNKWRQVFVALLIIYPAIALVFGASELASTILSNSAGDMNDNSGMQRTITELIAAAIRVLPLFVILPMLKGSLNAIPALGNLANKMYDKTTGGFRKRAGERLSQGRKNFGNSMRAKALNLDPTKGGRFRRGVARSTQWVAGGKSRTEARDARFESEVKHAQAEYIAKERISSKRASVAEKASAVSALNRISEEEISNIMTLNKHEGKIPSQHLETITNAGASSAERAAAIRAIGETGGMGDVHKLARASNMSHLADVRQEIQSVVAKRTGANNPAYSGASIAKIGSGEFDGVKAYTDRVMSTDFNPDNFLAMHDAAKSEMLAAVQSTPVGSPERKIIQDTIAKIKANPNLKSRASDQLLTDMGGAAAGAQKQPDWATPAIQTTGTGATSTQQPTATPTSTAQASATSNTSSTMGQSPSTGAQGTLRQRAEAASMVAAEGTSSGKVYVQDGTDSTPTVFDSQKQAQDNTLNIEHTSDNNAAPDWFAAINQSPTSDRPFTREQQEAADRTDRRFNITGSTYTEDSSGRQTPTGAQDVDPDSYHDGMSK